MLLACPSCGRQNRIPDVPRRDGTYRCGGCRVGRWQFRTGPSSNADASCLLCQTKPMVGTVTLRDGTFACWSCVFGYEERLRTIEAEIFSIERKLTRRRWREWLPAWLPGSLRSGREATTADRDRLVGESAAASTALARVYEQYWRMPPDWRRRRLQVIERARRRCERCGKPMSWRHRAFHVHHVIPRSLPAGHHGVSNLQLLCRKCHLIVHARGC